MKTLKALGERKAIELILERLEKMPQMPIPFGDDVSAYLMGDNKLAILKTDMLVGKTDIPKGMSLWHAARKAVVMNISDFAAKGVKPLVILVALGIPSSMTQRELEEAADGLNAGTREYGAYIVGGDTGEASDIIISLSVFGVADKSEIMLRSGAKPGDIVATTGFFGKTSAGLKILLKGLDVPKRVRDALVDSVLMPKARLNEGLLLGKTGAVTAAIDSSDGLAWSLHEIAKASNVGFLISNVPVADEVYEFAEIIKLDPLDLALYGGEEYELVLTVNSRLWEKAKSAIESIGGKLLPIGKVTVERQILLEIGGERRVIEPRGWEHFKSNV
ncbi:MAG: thiamine-phosphate kinase [Candidatus Bathyarchaeia archaeon]|nr:MAG: thiamine-phosphate kinase [Candidatus Bathyarchaeota archaeon]